MIASTTSAKMSPRLQLTHDNDHSSQGAVMTRQYSIRFQNFGTLTCLVLIVAQTAGADSATIAADWNTRTATCPASISQASSATLHLTNINDLLVDFNTGTKAEYVVRVSSTPISVVPPQNPFVPNAATPTCILTSVNDLTSRLNDIRTAVARDQAITPTGKSDISLGRTIDAIKAHPEVIFVLQALEGNACSTLFDQRSTDPVVQWLKLIDGQHTQDFTVNLQPNQNYHFRIDGYWNDRKIKGASLDWKCGETDILTLSVGPLVTTLPYRTYSSQNVPSTTGGTTTKQVLIVSGTTNANILGAALLNYNLPIPYLPDWSGLAFSTGPVYTLGNSPSVSKLGLFVGGSIQLYRSLFLTPGVHIGQFADYPAGLVPGATIPSNFGGLNPVVRNTVHFAIGLTFKTNSFKTSSAQKTNTAENSAPGSQTANNAVVHNAPAPAGGTSNPGSVNTAPQPSPGGVSNPPPATPPGSSNPPPPGNSGGSVNTNPPN